MPEQQQRKNDVAVDMSGMAECKSPVISAEEPLHTREAHGHSEAALVEAPSNGLIAQPDALNQRAEARSLNGHPPRGSSKKRCQWGYVQSMIHSVTLDASKCPSDGLVPIGLGDLQEVIVRRVMSYEAENDQPRCVRGIPSTERLALLRPLCRMESIEVVERDCIQTKRQRRESALESDHDVGPSTGETEQLVATPLSPLSPTLAASDEAHHPASLFDLWS